MDKIHHSFRLSNLAIMSTKRLTFEIDESLHAQLKAEASAKGLHLGPYCEAILEAREGVSSPSSSSVKKIDATSISAIPLNILRNMCVELAESQPKDWERSIRLINTEIRRRYRV